MFLIYIPICFYFNNGIEIGQRRLFSIYIPICFYFNKYSRRFLLLRMSFTFQYVSILIERPFPATLSCLSFTFQYVSILIVNQMLHASHSHKIYIPICFYFNKHVPPDTTAQIFIYIPICFYFNQKMIKYIFVFNYIYIPICFYFNPSPEFPLLFYLISPLSVDQPKFTNILPYLLH